MKRATLGLSLAAGVLAALSVVTATPAQAHTSLLGSTPSDGDVLTELPAEVDLVFSEDLLPESVKVSVSNGDGTVVVIAAPTVDGADVTFPWPGWPGTATTNSWSVNYRVVSQDGHPVSDAVTFSAPVPAENAAPSASAASAAAPSAPAPSAAAAAPAGDSGGTSPVVIVMIVAGLAAGIGIGLVLAMRRRPTP